MTTDLVSQLNDFSLSKRMQALEVLITEDSQSAAEQEVVNLRCHTFFSFHAYEYSPTALAWLAKQREFTILWASASHPGGCRRMC